MKWPSLASLWKDALAVGRRFPLQVLIVLLALCTSWLLVNETGRGALNEPLQRLLLTCNLTFVLLLSADLFAESHHSRPLIKWALRLLCLGMGIALDLTLRPQQLNADLFRAFLLAFSFHLLLAFAPFIRQGNLNAFWEYNKILFIRILTAALYALVLYLGLAMAIWAVKALFNMDMGSRVYMYLFATLGIGFTSMFFMSGIPASLDQLQEEKHPYPKGLKVFSQYVLIPLLSIYLAILLVYEAKILISWSLPKGMVSALILGYAVFGILSLLLIHPVKAQEGNSWMRIFARLFYLMMIPLVVLLLLAIAVRVKHYGFTELRYLLLVLAGWLTVMTAYFLISKKDNIKIIPISLSVLALLSAYGPQSAFSVARHSQIQRLKRLLPAQDNNAQREKPEIIRYLVTKHGLSALQDFTPVDLQALELKIHQDAERTQRDSYQLKLIKVDAAFSLLKVKERYPAMVVTSEYGLKGPLQVKGYDYVLKVNSGMSGMQSEVDNVTWKLNFHEEQLEIKAGAEQVHINTAMIRSKISRMEGRQGQQGVYSLPQEVLSLNAELPGYQLQLVYEQVSWRANSTLPNLNLYFDGYLLVKIK